MSCSVFGFGPLSFSTTVLASGAATLLITGGSKRLSR